MDSGLFGWRFTVVLARVVKAPPGGGAVGQG
jgi:hypothetical protein